MKRKVIIVLTAISVILILLLLFFKVFMIFSDKDSTVRGHHLISSSPDEYDLIFLGSSHIAPIQPMYLWEKYGITSYNLSTKGGGMDRCKASFELALDYITPELVIIETDSYWKKESVDEAIGRFHDTFDPFPLTLHKIKLVNSLCSDIKAAVELIFPFYRYHSRYGELTHEDFEEYADTTLGANIHFESVHQDEPSGSSIPVSEISDDDPSIQNDLRSIIELCLSKDIDVMLVTLPYPAASESKQRRYHMIYDLAKEYGIYYYNFLDHEAVVNYEIDFRDAGHLNVSGAVNVMDVIAREARAHYDIKDRRNEPEVSALWNGRISKYVDSIVDISKDPENTGLKESLVMMRLPYFCGEVFIKNSKNGYLHIPGTISLMDSIVGSELSGIRRAKDDGLDYLFVYNRYGGTFQEYCGDEITELIGDTSDMDGANITIRDANDEALTPVAEISIN